MSQKKINPSILKFKEFVRNNPNIIQEVRKGNATWQELYEDWYLLGEEDSRWDSIGEERNNETEEASDKKTDLMSTITGMLKKMDPNQVQHHINSLSQAIGAIQGLLTQFQGSNQPNQAREIEGPKNPFSFRKD
ncbi:MAG TPA: YlbD family protein [Bacillales bacterium]|nr:YlbD family protein [Bacillales bacterium]